MNEENVDFTKCSICNCFFKHIVLIDDTLEIVKHITGCNRCIKLLEKKRKLESEILDIDYEFFVRRDDNST